jgi:ankyrin repeat protein
MLVDKGAYVHATNELRCTPLHAAAMHGQAKAIEYLLERGADPRASDSEGYCPMHYAAGEGHVAAVDSLVTKGFCDETLKTFQGLTVLHIAVTEAQENMVNYLLQRKPELASIPDSDGVLPIQYAKAADDRNEEIVNLLAVGNFFPQNDSIMLVLALHTRSPRFCIELYLSPYTYSTDRSNVSESVCLCTERRTLLDTDAGTLSDTFCL